MARLAVASMEEEEIRAVVVKEEEEEEEVLLVHSQVRRIKQEDEEVRQHLQRLQALEMRPVAAGFRELVRQASLSPSPLRRAGHAISVGD